MQFSWMIFILLGIEKEFETADLISFLKKFNI